MQSEKYIEDVLVTAAADYKAIAQRLSDPAMIDMLHASMGLVTEAAEVMDMIKKHIYYGKELDLVNLEEELGDQNWYQSLAIHASRLKGYYTSWEQIWQKNINKLKLRYGEQFSSEKAINRDLQAERELLENT